MNSSEWPVVSFSSFPPFHPSFFLSFFPWKGCVCVCVCVCVYIYIYFFFFKHLYWSIIALQYWVSFCCITKWISYMYTYIPISPPSCISLPPSLSHPSRWSQSTELISLCDAAASIYFTFGSAYMSVLLSHLVPAYPYPRDVFLN